MSPPKKRQKIEKRQIHLERMSAFKKKLDYPPNSLREDVFLNKSVVDKILKKSAYRRRRQVKPCNAALYICYGEQSEFYKESTLSIELEKKRNVTLFVGKSQREFSQIYTLASKFYQVVVPLDDHQVQIVEQYDKVLEYNAGGLSCKIFDRSMQFLLTPYQRCSCQYFAIFRRNELVNHITFLH